jgi:type I restriction enzyme M protein
MNGIRARETVQKLWNASKSLQGGGVSYYEYVTELTYLLLLKMLEEVKRDGASLETRLPEQYRWRTLKRLEGEERLIHYRQLLLDLGNSAKVDFPLVNQIYTDAKTSLTKATALSSLVTVIDQVDWYAAEEDGLGDLYEGLLERTTSERKSKAGQYFTPRPLIDTIIALVKPKAGEVIQDPAAGTGGFLISAHRAICAATDDLMTLKSDKAFFQRHNAYEGAELITGTHRLNTMNLLLHGINEPIDCIDALTSDADKFDKADLILTNPPFNKFPERVARADFTITASAAKGPLPFMEHVVRGLKIGGRAAIVIPDNVLFEDNMGRDIRTWMMDLCDVHTILRLPTGIFYAQGVKTNVVFLTKRAEKPVGATSKVWFYDLRAQMPNFGKARTLTKEDFAPFVEAYGDDPHGLSPRTDHGEAGRFRAFTREEIAKRNDNLDISWLRDDEEVIEEGLTEPEDIAAAILGHLRAALAEIEAVEEELAV